MKLTAIYMLAFVIGAVPGGLALGIAGRLGYVVEISDFLAVLVAFLLTAGTQLAVFKLAVRLGWIRAPPW